MDVAEKDWFYKQVMFCADKGLMIGTDDTHFSPDLILTRTMAITVLYRAAGELKSAAKNIFSDLDSSKYYYAAVLWGIEKGLIVGYPDGTFRPNDTVTREEFCAMYYRYHEKVVNPTALGKTIADYKDGGKVSSWAESYVTWALANGVVQGYEDNTLRPLGPITRAEAVTIFYNDLYVE